MTKKENPVTAMTVLADPALDTEKFMLEGIDTAKEPQYSVSEMAKVFFARSSHWVRWLETDDSHGTKPAGWRMMLDGERLVPIRTASNARKYDLALIEKIAHALVENESITITQLRHALTIVRTQARMYNYID